MITKFRPIILAGGVGKRLWPLSTEQHPKQFFNFFRNQSLLDLTLNRFSDKRLFLPCTIISNSLYKGFIDVYLNQSQFSINSCIYESQKKNTGLAILLAVFSQKEFEKEYFIVSPSDHLILNREGFIDTCKTLRESISSDGLTLLGARVENADPEYGYIICQDYLKLLNKVDKFIEKPNKSKANRLYKSDKAFWNCGFFIFQGAWLKSIMETKEPELLDIVLESISQGVWNKKIFRPNPELLTSLNSISFDKLIVENNKNTFMSILNSDWSDLGSWSKVISSYLTMDLTFEDLKIESFDWGRKETIFSSTDGKVEIYFLNDHQIVNFNSSHTGCELSLLRGKARLEYDSSIRDQLDITEIMIPKDKSIKVFNTGSKEVVFSLIRGSDNVC